MAAILYGEWPRDWHEPWNRYASMYDVIVSNPNTQNDNENMLRAMLAPAPRVSDLLSSLPEHVRWYRVAVPVAALADVYVVCASFFLSSGCMQNVSYDRGSHSALFRPQRYNESWESAAHCAQVGSYSSSRAVLDAAGPHARLLVEYVLCTCLLTSERYCLLCQLVSASPSCPL